MEKELRIREGMLMAGMRSRVYWLSWFVTHYSTLTIIATLMAFLGTYPVRVGGVPRPHATKSTL
jgi:hypothetical protein